MGLAAACSFLGVPIIRTIVYWVLYWGALILEDLNPKP